ncbi:MAG: hypothetical protein K2X32_07775 [Phycisphaerales bacterium]|nr:hypothetical protein [Phycisphaerales bacterium]
MIKNTEAVQAAKKYAAELFSDASIIRLEEIELDDSGQEWLVTVSLRRPTPRPNPSPLAELANPALAALAAMGGTAFGEYQLDLKIVRVNANTGEVVSVKNRAA